MIAPLINLLLIESIPSYTEMSMVVKLFEILGTKDHYAQFKKKVFLGASTLLGVVNACISARYYILQSPT